MKYLFWAEIVALSVAALTGSCEKVDESELADASADAGAVDAGVPDAGVPDRDFDGVPDSLDKWPDDRCCNDDKDGDGVCDGRDHDLDGDGYDDFVETLFGYSPADPASHPAFAADAAGHCTGLNPQPADDTDGDGAADAEECAAGSDPFDPRSLPGLKSKFPDGCDFGAPDEGPVWLKGDLHMHTTYSEDAQKAGGDDVAATIAIAEWFGDPAMVALHPEYKDRGLDFIAMTDHRVAEAMLDPMFFSNRMLLVQAEEFGGDGHSNVLGISTVINDKPETGRTATQQIQHAIDLVHAQGGVWSINHPTYKGDYWFWDVTGYDAVEIWNIAWGVPLEMVTSADIDKKLAEQGAVNPIIRTALAWSTDGRAGMYLHFWEANLTAGRFIPPVGGSDRHEVVMPGYPTTWVMSEDHTVAGMLDGIKKRHTFVGRSPAGPTIDMTMSNGKTEIRSGDIGALGDFTDATVKIKAGRAAKGRVELVEGVVLDNPTQEQLLSAVQPRVVATLDIPDNPDAMVTWSWKPSQPSWLYARVLEKIDLAVFDEKTRANVEALFENLEKSTGSGGIGDLLVAVVPFVDQDYLISPPDHPCRPEKTKPGMLECVPADKKALGTFFIPEDLDRVLNVVMKDGKVTEYAMGAVSSAFVLK